MVEEKKNRGGKGLIVGLVGVVVCVLLIVGIWKYVTKEAVELPLPNLLPKDTIAFVSAKDIHESWRAVVQSSFWQKFTGLKMWQDANTAVLLDNITRDFYAQTGFKLNEDNIMDVVGREVGIAIIGGGANLNVILFARVGAKTKLMEFLKRIAEGSRAATTMEVTQYSGYRVVHLQPPAAVPTPIELSYVMLDNLFVLTGGTDPASVEKVIDRYNGKLKDSLSESSGYQQIISSLTVEEEVADTFYVNLESIQDLLRTLTLPGLEGETFRQNIEAALSTVKRTGGVVTLKNGILTKFVVVLNKQKMPEEQLALYEAKPQKSASLGFVPENTILYLSANSLNMPALWKYWMKTLREQNPVQASQLDAALLETERNLDISLEKDVMSWIGSEAAFLFSDVDLSGIYPVPKIAGLVQVKDKASAQDIITKLITAINENADAVAAAQAAQSTAPEAAPPAGTPAEGAVAPAPATPPIRLTIESRQYKNREINRIDISALPARNLQPAYAFVEDFLVFAINEDTIEEVIDTWEGTKTSITKAPGYRKIEDIYTDRNNQMVYIHAERLLDKLIELCHWAIKFQSLLALPTEGEAPMPGVLGEGLAGAEVNTEEVVRTIREDLIPLLECFKTLKIIAVNTVHTDLGVERVIAYRIEDISVED